MSKTPFLMKIWWLAVIGGVTFATFIFAVGLFTGAPLKMYLELQSIAELSTMWLVGALITFIFGTPILFLADHYFSGLTFRYVISGFIAASIAWLAIAGPLFNPARWHFADVRNWTGSGIGHIGIYMSLGLIVGVVFTILVKRTKHHKNPTSTESDEPFQV